ncbi:MAG: hypothetical protein QOJ13_2904 [Gaiellales bacterium]|nr:hypothetical protein [Gaiellales bacterium]
MPWKPDGMERADWALVARVTGVALLFAGWVAVLAARSAEMSRDGIGASLFLIGLAMLGVHVFLRRQLGASPDAAVATLFGIVAVPAGLTWVLWTTPSAATSDFDLVEPASVGSALLVSAAVFAVAWWLGREPRWLFVIPVVLVAGIELHLTSASLTDVGGGGGDWSRFLVLLAAIAGLVAVARHAGDTEERNLLVAAALLVPPAFVSVPIGDGPSVLRDLVGVAFLVGMGLLARRRITPGIGLAILVVSVLEVVSLAQHGRSVIPGLLVLLLGATLVIAGTTVFFGARHQKKQSGETLEQ